LEYLERIAPVAPPPFLFTRIEARIAAQLRDRVPVAQAVAVFCGLALLLVVNTWALRPATAAIEPNAQEAAVLGTSLGLSPSNQLYHE
jgi:hypothetical protein